MSPFGALDALEAFIKTNMQFILDTLGKVGFEWQMGLFNLINFLIVFFILKRFAFEPIQRILKEREEKTRESVENFTKAKTALGQAEQKAQSIVDEAKVAANEVRENATEDGKVIAEQMKTKARGEIELLIKQAKKNIEIDRKKMQNEIRDEAASLVVRATEKILGEKLSDKKDESLVKETLKTINN